MGFSPREMDAQSAWQVLAAIDGFAKAHGTDDGKLSADDEAELWEWLQGSA